MSSPLTVECDFHFDRRGKGARKVVEPGPAPIPPEPGRVPRVARLMALAIRLDEQLRAGEFESYAEVGELGQVTRARVSQIMSLVNLAPVIQDAILHLPRTLAGRDQLVLREILPIATVPDWIKQLRMWAELELRTTNISAAAREL